MEEEIIRKIFKNAHFGEISSITKSVIGFSNDVYKVDNKYILKVSRSSDENINLEKEVYLCNLFKDKIPVPKVLAFDSSKSIIDKNYIIFEYIQGDNLYAKWHLYTGDERKDIINQICKILRFINNAPYTEFAKKFAIDTTLSWEDVVYRKIEKWLVKIENINKVPKKTIEATRTYLENNRGVLAQEKMSLVYTDEHFDNFLVVDAKIVGILDLGGGGIASLDFELDIVRRMVDQPSKYASTQSEGFVRDEDYHNLLELYKEFYPELFAFKNLEQRLKMYEIDNCLKEIFHFEKFEYSLQLLEKIIAI